MSNLARRVDRLEEGHNGRTWFIIEMGAEPPRDKDADVDIALTNAGETKTEDDFIICLLRFGHGPEFTPKLINKFQDRS